MVKVQQIKPVKKVTIATPAPVKKLTIPQSSSESEESQESVEEITPAQTVIIPETQDILAELGLEEENDPMMIPVQKAQELQSEVGLTNLMSIMELIELMWETGILKTFLQILKQVERQCVKKRNLVWKRHTTLMQQGMLHILKNLKVKSIELAKCSFEDFKKVALDGEFSMMFTRKNLPPLLAELIMEIYQENTGGPSSSCATMTTTTMSSMIAPTAITPANAQLLTNGNPFAELDADIHDELLLASNTQSNTGQIYSSILKNGVDTYTTWTSPVPPSFQVII